MSEVLTSITINGHTFYVGGDCGQHRKLSREDYGVAPTRPIIPEENNWYLVKRNDGGTSVLHFKGGVWHYIDEATGIQTRFPRNIAQVIARMVQDHE